MSISVALSRQLYDLGSKWSRIDKDSVGIVVYPKARLLFADIGDEDAGATR
jgi:hypothetical protein